MKLAHSDFVKLRMACAVAASRVWIVLAARLRTLALSLANAFSMRLKSGL